jgi:hypothetical protein
VKSVWFRNHKTWSPLERITKTKHTGIEYFSIATASRVYLLFN